MWKFKRLWVGPGQLKPWDNKCVAIAYHVSSVVETDGVCLYNHDQKYGMEFECWVVEPNTKKWREYLTQMGVDEKREFFKMWLNEQMIPAEDMELIIK